MTDPVIKVADNFWNIRGSYKVAGLLDVGTQASMVRLKSGRFALLDTYSFSKEVAGQVGELTDRGRDIEAIINLHPFHTMHVQNAHKRYPDAVLYGTARHHARFPRLPWAEHKTEDAALHAKFADDFEFSVPRGVDFISDDESVHFSSVLAYHPGSKTIHVDDTFNYLGLPGALRMLGLGDSVSFHPTLARALEKRAGAASDFKDWASGLIKQWRKAKNLCAAHTAALLDRDNAGAPIHDRLLKALEKTAPTLATHERKYG